MTWRKANSIKKVIATLLSLIIIFINPLVAKADNLRIDPTSTDQALNITGAYTSIGKSKIESYSNAGPIANISAAGSAVGYYLDYSGHVWAWGSGSSGELGNGATNNSNVPVQVLNLSDVIEIAGGYVTGYALDCSGHVWAWGYGGSGRLGNGTTSNSSVPVQVSNLSNIIAIAGGYYAGYALDNTGHVWAWGGNGWGQLGNGTTNSTSVPVQVSNLSNIVAIAGGEYDGYALDSSGHVWDWGYNGGGALGNGKGSYNSSVPVQVSNLSNIIAIAGGGGAGYALDSSGYVWAWGSNSSGQLGNGTTNNSNVPVQVSSLSNIMAITGGGSDGYALDSSGHVWAWGYAWTGELGNGTFESINYSTVPVQVSNLSNIVSIASGSSNAYALNNSGHAWAWGSYDGLGNGTWNASSVPVLVSKLPPSISGNISQIQTQDPTTVQNSERYYGEPIDTATGAHVLDQSLLKVQGAEPFSFNLHYNSLLLKSGPFGNGWESNYQVSLQTQSNGNVIINWSANRFNTFVLNGSSYLSVDQAIQYDQLVKNADGTFTLTRKDNSVYHFDSSGKLTQLGNGHGQYLNMSYDSSGRLIQVTEPVSGQTFSMVYNSSGLVQSVSDNGNQTATFTYDGNKNLTIITKPNGTLTYTYNSSKQVLTGTDPLGVQVFSDTYDSVGRIVKQIDAENHTTTLSYDESSQPGYLLTTVTDRNGQTRVYKYDAKYNLLSLTDPLGNKTQYTYDTYGNKTSETNANGNTTTYTYDAQGNLLTTKDPQGNTTTMTYDSNNNMLTMINAAGKTINFAYGSMHNLTSITDPLNNITAFTYDNTGLLQSKTTPKNATTVYNYVYGLLQNVTDAAGNTVSYQYDSIGREISQTNPDGGQTQTAYNNYNEPTSIIDPLGDTTSYTYDTDGNKLSVTDPNGNTTIYIYDQEGNLTSQTDPLGDKTLFQYDDENHLIQVTDALGNATTYQYDAAGRRSSTTDPLGNITKTQYDAVGNLSGITDALNNQILTIAYDSLNKPITKTDALGNKTTNQYDLLNRITETIDPLGHTTQFQYDDNNKMIGTIDPNQGTSGQAFDADGNRISLTDPNNNQLTFTYDALDRITNITSTTGSSISYQYNSDSLVSQMTNTRGQAATYQYDKAGRIISSSDPTGTITYTYDKNGNMLTTSDSVGTISKSYNTLNRVLSYTDVYGNVIKYQYDAVGNLTSLTYPDGKVVNYTYDKDNRMTSVTDWAGRVTSYTYDADGRLLTTTRPDGSVETKTYDVQGQLLESKDVTKDGTVIDGYTYSYDAVGNVLSEKNPAVSEPSNVTTASAITLTYGPDNSFVTYNGQPVTYDADGNMIIGPLGSNAATQFIYDSHNRLTSAGGLTYTYDAMNNRMAVTDAQGNLTRQVVNPNAALSQLLMETDANGNILKRYVYGLGLVSSEDSTSYRLYHYDHRGNNVALTDQNGVVTDRIVYSPFGEILNRTGTTSTPFLFDGRDGVYCDSNGLLYMRARYYNPQISSFISQDTLLGSIDVIKSMNRYTYTRDNPINYIDPQGHDLVSSILGGVALTAGVVAFGATAIVSAPIVAGSAIVVGALASGFSMYYTDQVLYKNKPYDANYWITQATNVMGVLPVGGLFAKGIGFTGKEIGLSAEIAETAENAFKFTDSALYNNIAIHAGFGVTAWDAVETYSESRKDGIENLSESTNYK